MSTLQDEFDTLLGACATASPHDQPVKITTFSDVHATARTVVTSSVRDFISSFSSRVAKNKADLPLFKLAQFGDVATDRGSFRHDDNLVAISGIVADYDAGKVSIGDAAARARAAGVAVAFIASPSHTAAQPRWRAVSPLATATTPDEHARMCARLNGALGGILAPESFTRSQSYFFGRLAGAPELEVAAPCAGKVAFSCRVRWMRGLGDILASGCLLYKAPEHRMGLNPPGIRQPCLAVVAEPIGFGNVVEGDHVINTHKPGACRDKAHVEVPVIAVMVCRIEASDGESRRASDNRPARPYGAGDR